MREDGATGYTSCKFPVTLIAQADNPGSSHGGGVASSAGRRHQSGEDVAHSTIAVWLA